MARGKGEIPRWFDNMRVNEHVETSRYAAKPEGLNGPKAV